MSVFVKYYQRQINFHKEQANKFMMSDMKKWLFHSGEVKTYEKAISVINRKLD